MVTKLYRVSHERKKKLWIRSGWVLAGKVTGKFKENQKMLEFRARYESELRDTSYWVLGMGRGIKSKLVPRGLRFTMRQSNLSFSLTFSLARPRSDRLCYSFQTTLIYNPLPSIYEVFEGSFVDFLGPQGRRLIFFVNWHPIPQPRWFNKKKNFPSSKNKPEFDYTEKKSPNERFWFLIIFYIGFRSVFNKWI